MRTKKLLPKKVKVPKKVKAKKLPSSKRVSSSTNSFYNGKIFVYSLLLLIAILITVTASQQKQILTQYAQTAPTPVSSTSATPIFTIAPTSSVPTATVPPPPTVTPTFGCLGTSCAGTIAPTKVVVTVQPSSTAGVTIILPTNPNGKTPPGFFVSLIHRIGNWFSKFVRFGGNPPGNQNIPGTNINPASSMSGNLSGAKLQGNRKITIIPPAGSNNNATSGGSVTPPANQQNTLQNLLNLFGQLFGAKNVPPKN